MDEAKEGAVVMGNAAEDKDATAEARLPRGKKRKVALFIAYVGAGYSVSILPALHSKSVAHTNIISLHTSLQNQRV